MSKTTYVTIEILDDQEDREWWEAMCLPDPAYWNATDGGVFAPQAFVKPRLEIVEKERE